MSSSSSTSVTARCLCRANTFTISVPSSQLPLAGLICHCDSCRHLTGCLYSSGVEWPSTLPTSPNLKTFAFSPDVNIHFCSTCGTPMFFEPKKQELGPLCVETGALAETAGIVKYTRHMLIGDTKDGGSSDWLSTIPSQGPLQRFVGIMDKSPEVPIGWRENRSNQRAPEHSEVKTPDTLKGSCKCGGVSFHLTRPDAASADPKLDLRWKDKPEADRVPWWLYGPKQDRYTTNCCCCESCRKATGTDFVSWAFVPAHNIVPADGGRFSTKFGTLKTYQSSEGRTWCFCDKCSAMCFLICSDHRPEVIDVAAGLLWSEEGARAEDWLGWLTEKISFDEDGGTRPLVEALREGLKRWNESNGDVEGFERSAKHLGYASQKTDS